MVSMLPMKSQGFLLITFLCVCVCRANAVLCGFIPIFVFAVLIAGLSSRAEHVPADILNESSLQRHTCTN